MKWTFGIITDGRIYDNSGHAHEVGSAYKNLKFIYDSIVSQNIDDDYEIIIVGGSDHVANWDNVKYLPFNEDVHAKWISKKKNILVHEAKYENIALMHDYVYLCDRWYKYFVEFGEDWDVCSGPTINLNGERYRDWITDPNVCPEKDIVFLDYDDHSKTDQQYPAMACFYVKKQFFLDSGGFDENLLWGQSEDIEWSHRVRLLPWNYKCNPNSVARLLKYKNNPHWGRDCNKRARHRWNAGITKPIVME